MEELRNFQERLDNIKKSIEGRNIENIGARELTDLRNNLSALFTEVDNHITSSRNNTGISNDSLAQIMFDGLNVRNQVRDLRSDVISELLVKEERIKGLNNEKENIINLESSLANFKVADELNMTDVERALTNLMSTSVNRKNEIDNEISVLENGKNDVLTEVNNSTEVERIGGAHLSPEDRASLLNESNLPLENPIAPEPLNAGLINGVDFKESNEADVPLPLTDLNPLTTPEAPVSSLETSSQTDLPIPPVLDSSLNPVEPPVENQNNDSVMPIPGVLPSDSASLNPEVPASLNTESSVSPVETPAAENTPASEESEKDENLPISVMEVVQPKPSLWQKVSIAISGAIAFMSTAIAVHTGLAAKSLNNMSNEATVQEENTAAELNDNKQVVPGSGDVNFGTTPQSQAEIQTQTSTEQPVASELNVPIVLNEGEAVFDTSTGVEVNANGNTYYHDNGVTNQLSQQQLEHNDQGQAVVTDQNLQYTAPAAAPAPATPAPVAAAVPDVAPENVVDANQYVQELVDAGNTQEAQDVLNAQNSIDWDAILGSGPTLQ